MCFRSGGSLGVEALPHESERDSRGDERRRVDDEDGLDRDHCQEHPGQNRPGDHRRCVARLKAPVGGHEVVFGDEVGQCCELSRVERDRERRDHEGASVDPPDRERIRVRRIGISRDDGCAPEVDRDHHPPAVDAVDPGSDHEPKEQIGQEVHGRADRETHRRPGELVDEQRQRERGERAPELGDRLAGPELPEVRARPRRSRDDSHDASCARGALDLARPGGHPISSARRARLRPGRPLR